MTIAHSRPTIGQDDLEAVTQALQSGMIAKGTAVQAFELAVAEKTVALESVACCSGTAAIVLALRSLHVGQSSEVILPSYVCRDVIQAVTTLGATAVLCDIGPDWRMTSTNVKQFVSVRTAAIIAVHIFGFVADIESIVALGIPVIADASQAFGAVGAEQITVYSFHATKCLTTGEGGMAVFRDHDLANYARALRDDSADRLPFALSDLQASLGLSQLRKFDSLLQRRFEIAGIYSEALAGIDAKLPIYRRSDIPFRYPILTSQSFAQVYHAYAEKGVSVRRGVDALLHRDRHEADQNFPNSVTLFRDTVSLPFYPALSEEDILHVLEVTKEIFSP